MTRRWELSRSGSTALRNECPRFCFLKPVLRDSNPVSPVPSPLAWIYHPLDDCCRLIVP